MGLTCRTVSGLRLIRPKSTPSAEITSYKPTPVPISALVVSSLGIINTQVMAILDRRREIGVLKALGAADGDIQKLFFVEAGAMGLLGGLLGVVFGWMIGRALTFALNLYLHKQELPGIDVTSVPWWLAAGAIGFAVVVSLVAGMYPASRAAKLNPVEALRYE